jgi:hypothetical protein
MTRDEHLTLVQAEQRRLMASRMPAPKPAKPQGMREVQHR